VPSIVLDLQRDALDKTVAVSDLLRRALVVSRKLRLREFEHWISRELVGYRDENEDAVPRYRELHGSVRARNPYRGWVPVHFGDSEVGELLSKRLCAAPVSEIESLVSTAEKGAMLEMPFQPDVARDLVRSVRLPTTLVIQPAALAAILDTVRTTVLNWAMKLEDDGITGEGIGFNDTERKKAQEAAYSVNNFFGPVQSLQLQQGTTSSVQASVELALDISALRDVVDQLRTLLPQSGVALDERVQTEADLATIEAQLGSPKPKVPIIRETLRSIRSVVESASGSALYAILPKLLQLLDSIR
jgi:hypothetical protein